MSSGMDFSQFVQWVFYGVIGFASVFAVSVLSGLRRSVDDLNSKIAIIIEKTVWIEKTLDRHQDEIERLKVKK